MANLLHERVFEFCEQYRVKHPNFVYALRERNKNERLEGGMWFQGTENYAFVGLYNLSGGTNMTRSFGLVFWFNGDKMVCKLENVFNEEKDERILNFYQQLRDNIGGFEKESETKYYKILSSDKGFEVAKDFLDNIKPKIDELAIKNNLQEIFISPEKFSKTLDRISEYRSINYWVFQANPTIYDISGALKAGILKTWSVKQFKKDINIGDKVILWVSGKDAGVYALATVSSPVQNIKEDPQEYSYYINPSQKQENADRVSLQLDYNLVNNPISKATVLEHNILKDLTQGIQGTNFQATQEQYDAILNMIEHIQNPQTMSDNNTPLNQILFGPPGTGKTYHTIVEAIKIVDNAYYEANKTDYTKLHERFRELLVKDWENTEGQIAFCTFHQSFSYEDFVEGIKPVEPKEGDNYLKYRVEAGLFKKICRLAEARKNVQKLAVSFSQEDLRKAVFYKISLGDATQAYGKEVYEYCTNNNLISIGFAPDIDFTNANEQEVNQMIKKHDLDDYSGRMINFFKNYLKTDNYVVVSNGNYYIRALGKVVGNYEFKKDTEIGWNHFRKVEWVFKDIDIPVSEFYGKNLSQQTIYKLNSDLIIPDFFVRERSIALDKQAKEKKNFVIVIDEINRGNVASIFGELITLIEDSKRMGNKEALEVVLPYSKEKFSVPNNVYIIGTMNTADRSVEALDTDLRRRFSFTPMPSKPELIKQKIKIEDKNKEIDLEKMLSVINERIEKLIDKDHQIGHSYFLEAETLENLKHTFRNKIIPLLEEYFFGDYGKIGLVLGDSFITNTQTKNDFKFANFLGYDGSIADDLKGRAVYKIKEESEWSFTKIYE